jgi:hypothetical protein
VATPASPSGLPPSVPMELLAARQVRVGNFVQISRMSLALLFGLLGGYASVYLTGRRPAAERGTRVHSGNPASPGEAKGEPVKSWC